MYVSFALRQTHPCVVPLGILQSDFPRLIKLLKIIGNIKINIFIIFLMSTFIWFYRFFNFNNINNIMYFDVPNHCI